MSRDNSQKIQASVKKVAGHNRRKKLNTWGAFDVVAIIILSLLALITLFPMWYVLIVSFSTPEGLAKHVPYLLPFSVDFKTYALVFSDSYFIRAFLNSVFVTVVGTFLNMVVSMFGAYALSKKRLLGRNFFLTMVLITMLFGGGMIPFYLVASSLGLNNTIWAMIFPVLVNTTYFIIMKNYFLGIPASLEESARIDGANDFQILFRIVLPISMPFVATFILFYAVDRWNEWWNAMLFINQKTLQPLQIYMRDLLVQFNNELSPQAQALLAENEQVNQEAIRMATIVVSTVPILCVYPFLQKYFTKGILIGSIKE